MLFIENETKKKTEKKFVRLLFKSYLRYKTITSQNVLSEAQVKNFLFRRKVMFRSQDIQVFVFLTILRFSKSVMS